MPKYFQKKKKKEKSERYSMKLINWINIGWFPKPRDSSAEKKKKFFISMTCSVFLFRNQGNVSQKHFSHKKSFKFRNAFYDFSSQFSERKKSAK